MPISSSGTEAPSRKLNAERAVAQCDVPFVALPGIDGPPVARGAPWSGQFEHAPADALGGHEAGLTGGNRDPRRARRPEHAYYNAWGRSEYTRSGSAPRHSKRTRPMGI